MEGGGQIWLLVAYASGDFLCVTWSAKPDLLFSLFPFCILSAVVSFMHLADLRR